MDAHGRLPASGSPPSRWGWVGRAVADRVAKAGPPMRSSCRCGSCCSPGSSPCSPCGFSADRPSHPRRSSRRSRSRCRVGRAGDARPGRWRGSVPTAWSRRRCARPCSRSWWRRSSPLGRVARAGAWRPWCCWFLEPTSCRPDGAAGRAGGFGPVSTASSCRASLRPPCSARTCCSRRPGSSRSCSCSSQATAA